MRQGKMFLIPILLFSVAFPFFAQNNSIEGKVVDSKTNEPIAFASIYLSGTTIGVSTDKLGYYLIKNIPKGKYNLVASIIGYKPKTIDISFLTDELKSANFFLEPVEYNLSPIEITGRIPSEWYKQLEIFKNYFLGANDFATNCEIKNPYIINFAETDDTLSANASQPIIISNHALGYRIECNLLKFVYDKSSKFYRYLVLSKFIELTPSTPDSLKEYQENRNTAYYGSRIHFLSSLINNITFRESGFMVFINKALLKNVDEFVEHDTITDKYFLKFGDCIQIRFLYKGYRKFSFLCVSYPMTEFSPEGYFFNINNFYTKGDMAKEGLATMLPRFWKPREKEE
jgi:hypothetical protein